MDELAASRERLLSAADADRRAIERDLHDTVQQHLIALAVNLQLARTSVDEDPAAAAVLIEQMQRDVQRALDDTMRLAQRVYPSLLEAGGLAATLRAAAVSAGVRASVDVPSLSCDSPELARTVCFCWQEALALASADARTTIAVREDGEDLLVEITIEAQLPGTGFDGLSERCATLGGRMTVRSEPGGVTRLSASLPLSR